MLVALIFPFQLILLLLCYIMRTDSEHYQNSLVRFLCFKGIFFYEWFLANPIILLTITLHPLESLAFVIFTKSFNTSHQITILN